MSGRIIFYGPKEKWHTLWALVGSILVTFLLVFLFGQSLKIFLEGRQLLSDVMLGNYYFGFLLFSLTLAASIFAYWRHCRKGSLLSDGKPQIILALSFEEGCQWMATQFYRNFCRTVNKRGFGKNVSVALVSPSSRVIRRNEADQILEDSEASIVVCGHVHRPEKGRRKITEFESLTFFFSSEGENPLGQALRAFPFLPEEGENLMGRSIPVEDFSFINQFLMGLSLTLRGDSTEARLVWSDLLLDAKKHRNNILSLGNLSQKAERWWVRNEMCQVGSIYETFVKPNLANGRGHLEAKEALVILENGRKFFSVSPVYFLYKAMFEFHLGEYRSSRRTIGKGHKKFPEWSICFEAFSAFLSLWRKFYSRAFRHYQSMRKYPLIPEYRFFALGFLGSVIRTNLHRKDLFFGLAFLRDHFNVTEGAAMEYGLFIKSCGSDPEIKCLLDYSDGRLKKHHKKEKKRFSLKEDIAA